MATPRPFNNRNKNNSKMCVTVKECSSFLDRQAARHTAQQATLGVIWIGEGATMLL
jgi:hypothetical protein